MALDGVGREGLPSMCGSTNCVKRARTSHKAAAGGAVLKVAAALACARYVLLSPTLRRACVCPNINMFHLHCIIIKIFNFMTFCTPSP
jgi:hypothetical protein